jgi:MraZ protein
MGMELKTGAVDSTLDDKGRIGIPLRFRDRYQGDLVITWGMQPCAWIMKAEVWEKVSGKLTNLDFTVEERFFVEHRYINQAQVTELDKANRIAIPGAIQKYAKLTKECTVVSAENHLEIWDKAFHFAYGDEGEPLSQGALAQGVMNKMGSIRLFKLD